jgi:hypothetical protein
VLDAGHDLVAKTDVNGDLAIGFHRAQGIGALDVVRIVDDDDEPRPATLDGHGPDSAQEFHAQALAQIFRNRLLGGESVKRHAVVGGDAFSTSARAMPTFSMRNRPGSVADASAEASDLASCSGCMMPASTR